MPTLSNAVPKYRKHRASSQAIVTINGLDWYLGPHGTKASKVEYDRLITEWLASGRSASFGVPNRDVTVVELVVDYVAHAKAYYGTGHTSELHRITPALRPLRELYGRTNAVEFGPLQLKAVRARLLERQLSRPYVNASVRRVVRFFRWAASEGRISASIPQGLAMVAGLRRGKTTARETKPILPVDDATVDATLPHLPEVVADVVRFQRFTGCRPAEVCTIRPADIDRTGEVWEYRPLSHKTAHRGKERVIFIGPQAQAVLLRYLARDAETHCFQPRDSEAKRLAERTAKRKTPLSCGNTRGSNRKRRPKRKAGNCYSTLSYGRAVSRATEKAFPVPAEVAQDANAAKHWRDDHRRAPNQLRHSAATEIRRRFGLEAAQVTLGHIRTCCARAWRELHCVADCLSGPVCDQLAVSHRNRCCRIGRRSASTRAFVDRHRGNQRWQKTGRFARGEEAP